MIPMILKQNEIKRKENNTKVSQSVKRTMAVCTPPPFTSPWHLLIAFLLPGSHHNQGDGNKRIPIWQPGAWFLGILTPGTSPSFHKAIHLHSHNLLHVWNHQFNAFHSDHSSQQSWIIRYICATEPFLLWSCFLPVSLVQSSLILTLAYTPCH